MKNFAPFRLDIDNQCLWRLDSPTSRKRILLTPKAFTILRYLVEHPGRLVTHAELLDAVWPGVHVQQEVLKSHIFEVRGVLGDDARKPLFIETLARRGYRFIAPVREDGSGSLEPPRGPTSALVGRDRPLSELHHRFLKMLKGERQLVFVTGEPGIGKTAVVSQFMSQAGIEASDARIVAGQCIESYGSKEPYYPILEALAALCRGEDGDDVVRILAAQAPTWLVQLPALLAPDRREALQREIQGGTRERMLREIGDALDAIAAPRPVVILLEDLQWVDHSTVDVISVLARRRGPAALMVVGTFRDDDVAIADHPLLALKRDLRSRQLCHEIALEPLGEPQVAEYLVSGVPTRTLPEGLAEVVYRHSEGNPLFMAAVLDHLTGRRLIGRGDQGWELRVPLDEIDLAVPENLRELIEGQLERLGPTEQRVLEVAALVQHPAFAVAVTAVALGITREAVEEVCERLSSRTRLLHRAAPGDAPDGTLDSPYEFAHALYREVLYHRIAPGRRTRLHRQAAEWAEAEYSDRLPDVASFLAYHFEHGLDWSRAVTHARVAADIAGRRCAPREAMVLLQHGLELTDKLPDAERATSETGILEQLAATYVVSLDPRAIDAYEALAARAASYGLVDVEVRALIEMVYPLSWVDAERALRVIERALDLSARQGESLQRARTRVSSLSRRIWVGGWNSRDAEDCRRALDEIRGAGDPRALASHLIEFNFVRWISSEYRVAHQEAGESLAILADVQTENPYLGLAHWLSHFTLSWSLLFLGEWGQALDALAAEEVLARKNGDPSRTQTLELYRAWIHLHAMDWPGVLQTCGAVLTAFDDPERRPWRRFCLAVMGSAEVASGRHTVAEQHLETARAEMDRWPVIHDWYSRMMLEGALTELRLAQGDVTRAREEGERFLEVTGATPERTWQALAWELGARIALADRDVSRAETCIDRALGATEGFEVPLAAWRVHGTAAELYARTARRSAAERHRASSRAIVLRLASSLPGDAPLRDTFLSAAAVRRILNGRG